MMMMFWLAAVSALITIGALLGLAAIRAPHRLLRSNGERNSARVLGSNPPASKEPGEEGSTPAVPWLSVLGFDPATFHPAPGSASSPVDLSTQLAPQHPRPICLSMPIILSPEGCERAAGEAAASALAQAASLTGIAVFSASAYHSGPRAYAERWFVEETPDSGMRNARVLALADLIAIQWGPGANRHRVDAWLQQLNAEHSHCPLGVKLPATHHLESDLAYLLTTPAMVIILDGSEAKLAPKVGTFGVDSALATHRAHQWLLASGLRARVSLIARGGIREFADIARLLALGADAVVIDASRFFTDRFTARPSSEALHAFKAANDAASWLETARETLQAILRTVGTDSLAKFRAQRPLIAHTEQAARVFQLPFDGWALNPRVLENTMDELVASYAQLNHVLTKIAGYAARGQSSQKS